MTDASRADTIVPLNNKRKKSKDPIKAAVVKIISDRQADRQKELYRMGMLSPADIAASSLYKLDTLLYCLRTYLSHDTEGRLKRAHALLDLSLELSERTGEWQGRAREAQETLLNQIEAGSTEGL